MSFALSMDGGALEWGSHSLDTVFAQRRNLASPAFLRCGRLAVGWPGLDRSLHACVAGSPGDPVALLSASQTLCPALPALLSLPL